MSTIPAVPVNANLTDPADFLIALYHAESFPRPAALDRDRWMRDYPIVELYLPLITNRAGRADARHATLSMLYDLGRPVDAEGYWSKRPREWMAVFREAFDRGLINRIAYGAAAAFLLTLGGEGNATPGIEPGTPAARQVTLNDLRRSSHMGLMARHERELWRALPETVTVYRGGYSSAQGSARIADAVTGMHWAVQSETAQEYVRFRGRQRGAQAVQTFKNSALAWPLAFNGLGAVLRPQADPMAVLGAPFLVRAEIPRAAVLAYKAREIEGELKVKELLVDFEMIDPATVTDITTEYRRLAS